MTTPRRYVRVTLFDRGAGLWSDRWKYTCLCRNYLGFGSDVSEVHDRARVHAASCPAVAAAMERDQLRAELDALRVKYAAASQTHDAWRRLANRNRAEADRMRVDRDRLRERLNQINPLNKDNDR